MVSEDKEELTKEMGKKGLEKEEENQKIVHLEAKQRQFQEGKNNQLSQILLLGHLREG